MIDKITYNYVCLYDSNCISYNKNIHITLHEDIDPDTHIELCNECNNDLKLLGIATNITHIGTQESRL